ncbi:MAG TPA: PadR family transcriptional regulator [Ktedonobacterales bacterium]|nr:PadR family transcriptional regulator [Ktedonobacterales bacterium]
MSLRYGILGLLAEEPLHGYQIKSRFEALLGRAWEVNIGQVYSTLQRLERDGLIEAVGERGDRGKLAYTLTAPGRTQLEAWLTEPETEPAYLRDALFLKLLLLRRLAKGNVAVFIARQQRVYLQRLRDLAALERQARQDGRVDLVLLTKGAILHTEADMKWLDACVEELANVRPEAEGNAE